MIEETKVFFISHYDRWSSFGLFNANAYPRNLSGVIDTCGVRFALIDFHTKLVLRQEDEDITRFYTMLQSQGNDLTDGVKRHSDLYLVAYYESIEFMSVFSNALYNLKAFLDVYAQLIVCLINSNQNNMTFRQAKIKGQELSGGRLINRLYGLNEGKHPYAPKLAESIIDHSRTWITEAVFYRNQFSHYTPPTGFVSMNVPLQKIDPIFTQENIRRPVMPNGQTVSGYCKYCQEQNRRLIGQTLALLPNVDKSLLSLV